MCRAKAGEQDASRAQPTGSTSTEIPEVTDSLSAASRSSRLRRRSVSARNLQLELLLPRSDVLYQNETLNKPLYRECSEYFRRKIIYHVRRWKKHVKTSIHYTAYKQPLWRVAFSEILVKGTNHVTTKFEGHSGEGFRGNCSFFLYLSAPDGNLASFLVS